MERESVLCPRTGIEHVGEHYVPCAFEFSNHCMLCGGVPSGRVPKWRSGAGESCT
jgi:hypothetical protein